MNQRGQGVWAPRPHHARTKTKRPRGLGPSALPCFATNERAERGGGGPSFFGGSISRTSAQRRGGAEPFPSLPSCTSTRGGGVWVPPPYLGHLAQARKAGGFGPPPRPPSPVPHASFAPFLLVRTKQARGRGRAPLRLSPHRTETEGRVRPLPSCPFRTHPQEERVGPSPPRPLSLDQIKNK